MNDSDQSKMTSTAKICRAFIVYKIVPVQTNSNNLECYPIGTPTASHINCIGRKEDCHKITGAL